ncbi:hypothetical protein WMF04_23105 [Sorangium sp. So ce260]|uniref:hypothetical protein n=1 Tax=Sorangium sp. So ce260 TaxID=3133291 RepID=UPI003F61A95C
MPAPTSTLTVNAQVSSKGTASLIEVDASLWTAASLGKRGVLLGKGDVFGTTSAIGLLGRGATTATLSRLPCTATSIAVIDDRAVAFCHEPLAVVPLLADGKPQSVQRLRRVMLDGAQVDGFLKGMLDNHGQPEDQSMYERPLVHAQLDRHGIPLIRQARFNWAGVVGGRVLAALDFPPGGNETVEFHEAMGVTVEYAHGRLSPLPLSKRAPSCTATTDSMIIGGDGPRWFGVLPLSPIEIAELDVGGGQLLALYKPRRLPSGELSDADVTQCAFSPLHGKLTCIDEQGALFEPSASGVRAEIGSFPKSTSERTVAMCGTKKGLNLLVKKRVKYGDEFSLYVMRENQRQGALVHSEEFDRGGLSCSSLGAVAVLSSRERALVVHLPD